MLCCFSLLSFIFHFRSLLHILKLILNSDSVLQLACNHSHINAFCQCNKHRTSEAGEIGSENLYHNGIQLLLQILSLPISVLFFFWQCSQIKIKGHTEEFSCPLRSSKHEWCKNRTHPRGSSPKAKMWPLGPSVVLCQGEIGISELCSWLQVEALSLSTPFSIPFPPSYSLPPPIPFSFPLNYKQWELWAFTSTRIF